MQLELRGRAGRRGAGQGLPDGRAGTCARPARRMRSTFPPAVRSAATQGRSRWASGASPLQPCTAGEPAPAGWAPKRGQRRRRTRRSRCAAAARRRPVTAPPSRRWPTCAAVRRSHPDGCAQAGNMPRGGGAPGLHGMGGCSTWTDACTSRHALPWNSTSPGAVWSWVTHGFRLSCRPPASPVQTWPYVCMYVCCLRVYTHACMGPMHVPHASTNFSRHPVRA